MTPELIKALLERQEQMGWLAHEEMNRDEWPGAGKPANMQTKLERGGQYWCKKNASASLACAMKISLLVARCENAVKTPLGSDDQIDLDKELAAAERVSADVLEKHRMRLVK